MGKPPRKHGTAAHKRKILCDGPQDLSRRFDARSGETNEQYEARLAEQDRKMRQETGGKTYDEEAEEFLARQLKKLS
jgi:hypothetical protein